jgi:AcrR family transcriptional regulator
VSSLQLEQVPLRQRRRAVVERVALDLALDRGYDAVTVEMICDAAIVAPSTFFNYFGSKERAALGPDPEPLDPDRLESFVTGTGDRLVELMSVLVAGWPSDADDRALLLKRLDLIERTPTLKAAHHARIERASAEVAHAATLRLRREGVADPEERGLMVMAVSHALLHWMIDRLRVEPATSWRDLVTRAVATLRAVGAA